MVVDNDYELYYLVTTSQTLYSCRSVRVCFYSVYIHSPRPHIVWSMSSGRLLPCRRQAREGRSDSTFRCDFEYQPLFQHTSLRKYK